MAAKVIIYRTTYCPYCNMAEQLFNSLGVEFEKIDITDDDAMRKKLVKQTGMRTVPQIFVGEKSLGGYTDTLALHKKGELMPLIEST